MVRFAVLDIIDVAHVIHRMSKVCESWSLEDLVEMEEDDMEKLLGFYQPGEVPSLDRLRLGDSSETYVFDGSFGWW